LKRFFQSEAGAAICWVLSAVVLAATISPWLYQAGKNLAEAAETKDLNPLLEWLGGACQRARFGRFFSRSLVISAAAMLPLLLWRIRRIRAEGRSATQSSNGVSWKSTLIQGATGCVIAGGMLWAMAMIFRSLGACTAEPEIMPIGKLMGRVIFPAVATSLLEESLFRGILLGLWLKFAKPLAACIGTSICFAFVHFLEPPPEAVIAHPGTWLAGFELLGKILLHFTNPRFFITDFATLFLIGMILARARLRTGGLGFSIGLHAGWVLAFKTFNLRYDLVSAHPLHPWGIGESLRSGLLPLLTLGLTAGVCHLFLRRFENKAKIS
jgi:membrane protease YdiL (CAAX protease family)